MTKTGVIVYTIDLEHGSVEVSVEYRYDKETEEVELLGVTNWASDPDSIGELVEYYVRRECCDDIEASIRANEA